MARRQEGKCFRDAGEQLDCAIGDGMGKSGDALALFVGGRCFGEFRKTIDEGALEACHAVSMLCNRCVLATI
jgi:hypothetical protein